MRLRRRKRPLWAVSDVETNAKGFAGTKPRPEEEGMVHL